MSGEGQIVEADGGEQNVLEATAGAVASSGDREYPTAFESLAAIAYAMLAAAGRTNDREAWGIEHDLDGFYDTLTEKPDADYTTSGRIRIERDWDGDDFQGLRISVEVGHIWPDDLPADFVALTTKARSRR